MFHLTIIDVYFWMGLGAIFVGIPIGVYLLTVELKRRYN